MKKLFIYFLVATLGMVQTSCLGSFKLTNVTYQWNQTIGSKWVNELVFVLFIPVYSITLVIDGFVLNAIDFWTEKPGFSLKEGESQLLTSKDNQSSYLITKTKNGYQLIQNVESQADPLTIDFLLDHESNTWYMNYNGRKIKLAQLIQENGHDFVNVYQHGQAIARINASDFSRDKVLTAVKKNRQQPTEINF